MLLHVQPARRPRAPRPVPARDRSRRWRAAGAQRGALAPTAPGSRRMELRPAARTHERARTCSACWRRAASRLDRRRLGGCGRRRPAAPSATRASCGACTRSAPSTRERSATIRSVEELPGAPDAAFIAAPNREVPAIAAALARRGAGGFVCFAAGFSETGTAEGDAPDARQLMASAGELPFFGPNCYGFVNFFDGVALWPDQVVGAAPRARRRAHLPERHDRAQPAVQ